MEGRESAGKERNTNRRRVGKEGILSLRLYYLALGSLVASRSLLGRILLWTATIWHQGYRSIGSSASIH
jgi:hypothetical protein